MDLKPSVLAVCFYSSRGALGDNFYTLCRALAPRSRLTILTSDAMRGRPVDSVDEVCYLDVNRSTLWRRLVSPLFWLRLIRFTRKRSYDLVFFYSEHPLHAVVQRLVPARRSLFWCMDPTPHSGSRQLMVTMYETAKRSLITRADRIVVACETLREQVISRYRVPAHKVMSTFHGVLENLSFPDIPTNGHRGIDILFFGRLEAYKGIDVLLEAVRLLQSRGLKPTVTIVGRGPFVVPPTQGVKIEGRYVEDRELAKLVGSSRVVVMPYLDATGSQVPQTAFSYGTPVIASAVGCLPEYIEDGVDGILVPPGNPEALATALERLLSDDRLWDSMSRNALQKTQTTFANGPLVERLLKTVQSAE